MTASVTKKTSRKGLWAFLAGLGIFFALLWRLDFFSHPEILFEMDLKWFGLSCALMAFYQFLSYLKWKVMYRTTIGNDNQPLLPVFSSVLVSGMLTPARSGDVLASLSWRGIQGKVLAWSIFNRISEGVMTIVLALGILGLFFHSYAANLKWVLVSSISAVIVLLIVFVFKRTWGLFVFHQIRSLLQKGRNRPWIAKLLSYEEKIEAQIQSFYETMEQFRKKHVLLILIAMTIVNRAVIIVVNIATLRALGVLLPWTDVLGILAATWVSVFLSPIPGGFGIGDVAPSLILTSLGYKNQAGSFIILNHLFDAAMVSFWAAMWWKSTRLKKVPASAERTA